MKPLRIGINALYLIPGGVGGTEIYLRNLLKALANLDPHNLYFVFTNRETDESLVPSARNFQQVCQQVRGSNRPARLLWEQIQLPLRASSLQLDCMLNPGFTAPFLNSCPNVTVFHDLQHKRHPEYFRWFDRPAWDLFLWLAVQRSHTLLADSEATRSDLVHFYKVPANRIRVVSLGVEEEFFSIAERRGAVEPYLLCASTLHPHKNIERLVSVFARFRETYPDFQLILAGLKGFRSAAIEALIASLGLQSHVRVTGWIPRAELYNLFQHATAAVYPSTFEGFGLPVIEAMAAGVPLACSDIEPLRSITAGTAVRFAPDSEEEMLAALLRIVTDQSLVPAARARAAQFTWRQCAEDTLAALRTAATGVDLSIGPKGPKGCMLVGACRP
ncbi:MAG: glycosyltransferase family 4 protein [Bryobacteraceae bacterium]|nr:glycosyltransferase family 4 protein [Bryobacteraceae bacterium]